MIEQVQNLNKNNNNNNNNNNSSRSITMDLVKAKSGSSSAAAMILKTTVGANSRMIREGGTPGKGAPAPDCDSSSSTSSSSSNCSSSDRVPLPLVVSKTSDLLDNNKCSKDGGDGDSGEVTGGDPGSRLKTTRSLLTFGMERLLAEAGKQNRRRLEEEAEANNGIKQESERGERESLKTIVLFPTLVGLF